MLEHIREVLRYSFRKKKLIYSFENLVGQQFVVNITMIVSSNRVLLLMNQSLLFLHHQPIGVMMQMHGLVTMMMMRQVSLR